MLCLLLLLLCLESSGLLELGSAAPDLSRRLQRWRNGWTNEETPLQLSPDQPEVQPLRHRQREVPGEDGVLAE